MKLRLIDALNTYLKLNNGMPEAKVKEIGDGNAICLLYTSPSPRDRTRSRMPSSA